MERSVAAALTWNSSLRPAEALGPLKFASISSQGREDELEFQQAAWIGFLGISKNCNGLPNGRSMVAIIIFVVSYKRF